MLGAEINQSSSTDQQPRRRLIQIPGQPPLNRPHALGWKLRNSSRTFYDVAKSLGLIGSCNKEYHVRGRIQHRQRERQPEIPQPRAEIRSNPERVLVKGL